ncbi:GNAT family N-acetyltransferase [Aeromonas media]
MFVSAEYRGKGLASRLINAGVSQALASSQDLNRPQFPRHLTALK